MIRPEDYPSKPTKAAPQGNVPHGWTNDAIRAARDLAYSNGLIPCLPWDLKTITEMAAEARAFVALSEIGDLFADGRPEVVLVWQEDNGVWCRAMIDWLTRDNVRALDYKSTTSAEPDAFGRHMRSMGYAIQSAFYRRGLRRLAECEPEFYFLAQEVAAPHACSLHALSNASTEIADAKVERAIQVWGDCLASGEWPGYGGRVHYQEPTTWEMTEHEQYLQEQTQ